ncbi:uncharacterized protein LOC106666418 isoform X2 [Cimex lectularius]|uniref:BESS domain-containing protein n=1 Tax=Cimex lectularius TaxID=79782 RepID=A0A8I6RQ43_CIMLE|nr:uncharacterized protein LOC106666418 isoform X2 [Cimex lectularius]
MKFFEILIPRRRRLKVVAATGNNYPTKSKAMATEEQTRTKLTGSQDTLQNKERQSFLKYVFVKKKHRDSKKDEVAIERISNEIANWVKNKIKQEHLGEEESVESFFEDENDYFYRSMALISKRLPKEDQANIRLQLCKLITDAETKSRLASEQADVKSISIQPKTTVPETKNNFQFKRTISGGKAKQDRSTERKSQPPKGKARGRRIS